MSVRLEPGTLLLSAPNMRDSNFMHTVILMCQHDDDGAFGLVINSDSNQTIAELFPEHPVLGSVQLTVRTGGPVGLDTLQVLHCVAAAGASPDGMVPNGADPVGADPDGADPDGADPDGADPDGADPDGADPDGADLGGVDLGAGLRIGADLDEVARYLRDTPDPDRSVRFVVGYSGWGEGQLDAEIRAGSWLPLAATPDLVFSDGSPEAVWRAAMGRLGGGGASLAHHPPDPTWN